MIRKLSIRYINSLGLFITFFTISLLFVVVSTKVIGYKEIMQYNNSFFSNNSTYISLNVPQGTNKEKVLDAFTNEKGIVFGINYNFGNEKDSLLSVKGLYFNDKVYNEPPIMSGRFLNKKDFQDNNGVAVIGKNFINKIKEINGEKYIEFNNIKFKIIGVLGYKNNTSFYDNWCVINLKHYLLNTKDFYDTFTVINIDNINEDTETYLSIISKNLKSINNKINLSINSKILYKSNALLNAINSSKNNIKILFMLTASLFINIINTTFFWSEKKRKEIGIRKAYGATKSDIIKLIVIDFTSIAVIASLLAVSINTFLTKYQYNPIILKNYNVSNVGYFSVFICLIIFSIIIGLSSSLISVKFIFSQEASYTIRES